VRISEEVLVDCSVKGTSGIGTAWRFYTPNTKITKKGLLWNNIVASWGYQIAVEGWIMRYVGECAARQVGYYRLFQQTLNSADS
jgi:hypothetical protein